MDLVRAERDLDNLIERRAREASKQQALEDLWAASVARDRERKRRENRAAWHEFYSRLSSAHARISEAYEAKAEALLEEEPGP